MSTGPENIAIQNSVCVCPCACTHAGCVCACEHCAYLCIGGCRRRVLIIFFYYSSSYFEKGLSLTPGVRLVVLVTPSLPQYWGYRHASDHTQRFT